MHTTECVCPILGRVTKIKPTRFSTDEWTLVQCEETGFVFLHDPPSYDAVANEFDWHDTFVREKQMRADREPLVSKLSQGFKQWRLNAFRNRDKMFELARRQVTEQTESLAILDVGSGRGHRSAKFLKSFGEHGIKVIPSGIEISAKLAEMSNSQFVPFGGSVVADTAYDGMTNFPEEHFDLVVMSCYLEHEAQPLEVLQRTHRVLKPGGSILVKVPNFNSFNRFWRGDKWCGFRFPDHVNYFTPRTLQIVAESAGYSMLPQHFSDRMPTSDNMYAIFQKERPSIRLHRAA